MQHTLLIVTVVSGSLLWLLEGIFPFFRHPTSRISHALPNLGVAALNTALSAFLMTGTLWGLLHIQPYWRGVRVWQDTEWITVLLVICYDFWMYCWHWLNHRLPFLWHFHRFHHSDAEMDITTGIRFHPAEITLSEFARFPFLALLGFTATDLLLYNLLSLPIILLHHSNLALPDWLDRQLALIIPSPNMHRQHHCVEKVEADTNYGSLLSLWDRLFGSLRYPDCPRALRLGVLEN
ncbi:MAG: sterol desaturase family protein [Chloroherpetonaceae bacterium]|nr:sterol desaturase family protein [Chloroherpetonaceae bacterium]MDW8020674.1 sterol desaturase family protein [Chloroherpetonaceae bacterium]MDW8465504.1 sterol desaturase family protein [Chloroherpetonaceae bacterium]